MSMMRLAMLATMATMSGMAIAEVSVMDIKCTPRNPWNGLVDIEYTIATDNPDADVYVNPVAYDGDRRITLFPSSLTGEGATNAVKAGTHTMVWDAKKDLGTFSSAHFQIKMYAGERLSRYIDIDLSSGNASDNYPVRLSHVGPDLSDDSCRTNHLWLRLVPPGEFWMGSPEDELGRSDNEDLHHVTLTKPFYIGVFPVTVQQWDNVCQGYYRSSSTSNGGSSFRGATNANIRALDNVYITNYSDSNPGIRGAASPTNVMGYSQFSFVGRLRSRVRNVAFDLPTEARWEYACRAGTTTALYNGKNLYDVNISKDLSEIASYFGNRYNNCAFNQSSTDVGTMPVGSYAPNALGLYDMLGNFWEICLDSAINNDHLGYDDVTDPQTCANVDQNGSYQYQYIKRGGEWRSTADSCRAARRAVLSSPWMDSYSNPSMTGFRICAEADF